MATVSTIISGRLQWHREKTAINYKVLWIETEFKNSRTKPTHFSIRNRKVVISRIHLLRRFQFCHPNPSLNPLHFWNTRIYSYFFYLLWEMLLNMKRNEKLHRQLGKTSLENRLCRLRRDAVTCCLLESEREEKNVFKNNHMWAKKIRRYRLNTHTKVKCGIIPIYVAFHNTHTRHSTRIAVVRDLKIGSTFQLISLCSFFPRCATEFSHIQWFSRGKCVLRFFFHRNNFYLETPHVCICVARVGGDDFATFANSFL